MRLSSTCLLSAGVSAMGSSGWVIFRMSAADQQLVEFAGVVQLSEILEAAHVPAADEDLRHGAPPALLHHLSALFRVHVHPHLGIGDVLRLQQRLGTYAEGADPGGIDGDGRGHVQPRSRGNWSCLQALMPPFSTKSFWKPSLPSRAAAVAASLPLLQAITRVPSFSLSSSGARPSSSARGMLRALMMCPALNSPWARRSSTAAPWLMSSTLSAGPTSR